MSNNINSKKLNVEEWVAIVVTLLLGLGAYMFSAGLMNDAPDQENLTDNQEENMNLEDLGLNVVTTTEGTGDAAITGNVVIVNYTGRLASDGTVFDSSLNEGRTPFAVPLGMNTVIQGWELGLQNVKEGQELTLEIPAELGYGANANGPIPANSDLIFDIEVIKILPVGTTYEEAQEFTDSFAK